MEMPVKSRGSIILVICVALVAVAVTWQVATNYLYPKTIPLYLGNGIFVSKVASSEADKIKGLSNTHRPPRDHAMLFVYDQDSKWGIWMKDMNYPIDIVWLDESKRVVSYVENVQPDSYPKIYRPDENARYVIEFVSGVVRDQDIKVGQIADFSLDRGN